MAGATNPLVGPYPKGAQSTVEISVGGFIAVNQGAATIIDTYIVPWDCYIRYVNRTISAQDTNPCDALTLKTVDSTALTIVADLAAPAQLDGVAQTLHADVINTKILKGNKIQMIGDTAASEACTVWDRIGLEPAA